MNLKVDLKNSLFMNEKYLLNYWVNINENIISTLNKFDQDDIILVKYEDLVRKPIKETFNIFSFLQVKDAAGIEEYKEPKEFKWGWGPSRGGDGGEIIKKLRVIPRASKYTNTKLITLIKNNKKCQLILDYFGYDSSESYIL